jgi:hypothetical protein
MFHGFFHGLRHLAYVIAFVSLTQALTISADHREVHPGMGILGQVSSIPHILTGDSHMYRVDKDLIRKDLGQLLRNAFNIGLILLTVGFEQMFQGAMAGGQYSLLDYDKR